MSTITARSVRRTQLKTLGGEYVLTEGGLSRKPLLGKKRGERRSTRYTKRWTAARQ